MNSEWYLSDLVSASVSKALALIGRLEQSQVQNKPLQHWAPWDANEAKMEVVGSRCKLQLAIYPTEASQYDCELDTQK